MIAPMTMPLTLILGVLLAGGRSRRMGGRDKALVQLAGRPLLAHAITRLKPQVPSLILNANGDPGRLRDFGLTVAPDAIPGFLGPLAGLLTGMLWARRHKPDVRYIVTAAIDTPFFPRDLVQRLSDALVHSNEVAIASSGGRDHPVFGLFPVDLADDLSAFLDQSKDRAVRSWLDRHSVTRAAFTSPAGAATDPFFNINTPADLAAADALLQEPDASTPMR